MLKNTILSLVAALALALPAFAQDEYQAQTAGEQEVSIEELGFKVNPLLSEQLIVEADAWLAHVVAKNGEIATQQVAKTQPNANVADIDAQLATLREQRVRLIDRLDVVVRALVARGGDGKKYRDYVAASTGDTLDTSGFTAFLESVKTWLFSSEGGIRMGLNIAKFLGTLLAFAILARIAAGVVRKAIGRLRKTSDLLREFFVNVTRRLVFFIGLIVALAMLEIDVTPFVAALGAAGFVIGFALQGTLSNFASGLMILIYRPYDIGEVVTVAGTTGKVDAMTLVSTTLRLPDNQTVVIPNNSIWGDVITNITGQTTRRVDMKFGCAYGDDLQKAQELLMDIVKNHPKTLDDPEPVVKVHELADSSVNFVVRPWANTADYWEVFWDVTRAVKDRFDAEGLNIPFPQRDVHLHQVNA